MGMRNLEVFDLKTMAFIREDERFTEDQRQDDVGRCAVCGNLIYPGTDAVGILDRGQKTFVCADCAMQEMTFTEWLSVLPLQSYEGEAGRVEAWANGEITRQASRLSELMKGAGT